MIKNNTKQLTIVDGFLPAIDCDLNIINKIIDWHPIVELIEKRHGISSTGRPAHPPIVLVKMSALMAWYNLSYEQTEAHVIRDIAFRQFVGLSLFDVVPDHTTLFRFVGLISDMMDSIIDMINKQLEDKGMFIKEVTMIDSSLLHSAARAPRKGKSSSDRDASWGGKSKKQKTFGYKMHIAVDAGSELIRKVEVSPANEHDSRHFESMVCGDEEIVMADKGYTSKRNSKYLFNLGIGDGIMKKGVRGKALEDWEKDFNKQISKIRSGVERSFGTLKRIYKIARMRCYSIKRNACLVKLACLGLNLKRATRLLAY